MPRVPPRLRSLARDRLLIAGALAILAGLWIFIELLDEALEPEPDEIDLWVIERLRTPAGDLRGPDWLTTAALDLTALGSAAVLTLLVVTAAAYLALRRDFARTWLLVAAAVLGQALSSVLKVLVGRERPDESMRLAEVTTLSFPSGHAMMAAVVYATLGAVIATTRPTRRERLFVLAAALTVIVIVGLTRVYLGVHYATDVLAGWTLGATWAAICLLTARRLTARKPSPAPRGDADERP